MSAHTWQDVFIAFIAAMPSIIAAWSSLRNGRKIDKQNGGATTSPVKKRPKKNGQHPDWFSPHEIK